MSQNEPHKMRLAAKRRRRALALAAGCCAVLVLAGVSMLLTARQKKQDAADASAADSGPTLAVDTLPSSGSVDAISITDADGQQLTFLQQADGSWQQQDSPDLLPDAAALDAILQAAAQLYAYSALTPMQDLSAYGLEVPVASVTLTDTASGQSTVLSIGSKNAVTGQYYLQVGQQTDTLYMVDDTLLRALQADLYATTAAAESDGQ